MLRKKSARASLNVSPAHEVQRLSRIPRPSRPRGADGKVSQPPPRRERGKTHVPLARWRWVRGSDPPLTIARAPDGGHSRHQSEKPLNRGGHFTRIAISNGSLRNPLRRTRG